MEILLSPRTRRDNLSSLSCACIHVVHAWEGRAVEMALWTGTPRQRHYAPS